MAKETDEKASTSTDCWLVRVGEAGGRRLKTILRYISHAACSTQSSGRCAPTHTSDQGNKWHEGIDCSEGDCRERPPVTTVQPRVRGRKRRSQAIPQPWALLNHLPPSVPPYTASGSQWKAAQRLGLGPLKIQLKEKAGMAINLAHVSSLRAPKPKGRSYGSFSLGGPEHTYRMGMQQCNNDKIKLRGQLTWGLKNKERQTMTRKEPCCNPLDI